MVKFSIILVSVFLVSYSLIIKRLPFMSKIALNVHQSQFVVAENYLFNNRANNFKSILVGSSMTEKLSQNILPSNVYNLGINGSSSITGLKLLQYSGNIPSKIYIEINVLTRKEDSLFLENFNHNWKRTQKEILPFLQERNQLSVIFFNTLQVIHPLSTNRQKASRQILLSIHERYKKEQSDSISFKLIKKNILELQKLIQIFTKKGTEIYLFRVPVEDSTRLVLNELSRVKYERKLINKYLLNLPNVEFIKEDTLLKYFTTDGIHLTKKSAQHFTNYLFRNQTENLNLKVN